MNAGRLPLFCDTALAERIERAFTARGAPVQVEPAHLVDPAIGVLSTDRGYRLTSFENVLGLALKGEPERVTPPGVEVRPSGEDEFEPWLDVVADGFAHPDAQGVSSPEEFPREAVARAMRDLTAGPASCATSRCATGSSLATPASG